MQRRDFHYHLPDHLIAQLPAERRGDSRLLCLDRSTGARQDRQFADLPALLKAGDLLVFNDTRVIPARVYGHKASGGKVELLLERILDECSFLTLIRASKSPRLGSLLTLDGGAQVEIIARHDDLFECRLHGERAVLDWIEQYGHMPLPPYIERADGPADQERYQTVYARTPGAVAAPTAGLHFDEAMLQTLKQQGVDQTFVTLHVGAGTFQPVRVDDIREHKMHSEVAQVPQTVCDAVAATRARGGRVIAVGTTAVRSLESAAQQGELKPFNQETNLFIYPGYEFKVIDGMITNFHLPESTLLMLVSAFAGREPVLAAYEHAVKQEYRFFSYGDAMLIL